MTLIAVASAHFSCKACIAGSDDGANMKIAAFVVPRHADEGSGWLATLQAETLRAPGPKHPLDRFVAMAMLPQPGSFCAIGSVGNRERSGGALD